MTGSYKIDISGDICIRKFYGVIHLATIHRSWIEMISGKEFGMYKGFLTDFIDAKVITTKNDLDSIISFYKSNCNYLNYKRNAVISLQPNLIVLTTLLEMDLSCIDICYYLKPFSIYEAAFYWLLKY